MKELVKNLIYGLLTMLKILNQLKNINKVNKWLADIKNKFVIVECKLH